MPVSRAALRLLTRTAMNVQWPRTYASTAGGDALHGIGTPITLQLWSQRLKADTDIQLSSSLAEPAVRKPRRTTITYPFTSDHALGEKVSRCWLLHLRIRIHIMLSPLSETLLTPQYRNPWGAVRIGKLLEDLDSLAGNVAYLHWYALEAIPSMPMSF